MFCAVEEGSARKNSFSALIALDFQVKVVTLFFKGAQRWEMVIYCRKIAICRELINFPIIRQSRKLFERERENERKSYLKVCKVFQFYFTLKIFFLITGGIFTITAIVMLQSGQLSMIDLIFARYIFWISSWFRKWPAAKIRSSLLFKLLQIDLGWRKEFFLSLFRKKKTEWF